MVSQLDEAAQNVRVFRGFHDWELESAKSFLDLVYKSPPGGRGVNRMRWRLRWRLRGSGCFDVLSFYEALQGQKATSFPCKSIWGVKAQGGSRFRLVNSLGKDFYLGQGFSNWLVYASVMGR